MKVIFGSANGEFHSVVDVANIRVAEILPILGNNCAEKESAAMHDDHKNLLRVSFFIN